MSKKSDLLKKEELAIAVIGIIGVIVVISFLVNPGSFNITGFAIYEGHLANGTYTNTEWNESGEYIQLTPPNTEGTWTSNVIDVGSSASWDNISWSEILPNKPTDHSTRKCSDTWSTNCKKCTDYTMDSCASASCDKWENVKKVKINATSVYIGDVVNVTVTAVCNDESSIISIAYYNETWNNIYSANCIYEDGAEDHSAAFEVTGPLGTQWVRGMDQYDGTSGVTCANDYDGDNDDVNFTVIALNTTSLKFQAHSDDDNSEWGDFIGPDGTSSTYYINPKLENLNVADNRYFQYKAYFSTEDTFYTPELHSSSIGYTEICSENWSCGNWSDCVNETQTRTCTDSNSCGTEENKPAESQNCTTEVESYIYTVNSSSIELELETNESIDESEIIIEEFASSPIENQPATPANKYVNISEDINDKLSWSVIKMYYTDEEIASLNESTLQMYYLNGTTWEALDSNVVTEENYVWANVTHFSTYGLFGESLPSEAEEPSQSPSTGDGGPTGSHPRGDGSHTAEPTTATIPAQTEQAAIETQEAPEEAKEISLAGAVIRTPRHIETYTPIGILVLCIIIAGFLIYVRKRK